MAWGAASRAAGPAPSPGEHPGSGASWMISRGKYLSCLQGGWAHGKSGYQELAAVVAAGFGPPLWVSGKRVARLWDA